MTKELPIDPFKYLSKQVSEKTKTVIRWDDKGESSESLLKENPLAWLSFTYRSSEDKRRL